MGPTCGQSTWLRCLRAAGQPPGAHCCLRRFGGEQRLARVRLSRSGSLLRKGDPSAAGGPVGPAQGRERGAQAWDVAAPAGRGRGWCLGGLNERPALSLAEVEGVRRGRLPHPKDHCQPRAIGGLGQSPPRPGRQMTGHGATVLHVSPGQPVPLPQLCLPWTHTYCRRSCSGPWRTGAPRSS